MSRNKSIRVPVPEEALVDFSFEPVHYADAFRIVLPDEPHYTMPELAHQLFGRIESFPRYVGALLYLRDILVKPLNIRTADDVADQNSIDDQSAYFETLQCSKNEIIMGEDDSHLDFRVSLLRTKNGEKSYLTVTTFVRYNNRVGRCYFFIIKPFHQVIVPACAERAVADLAEKQRVI